MKKYLLLLFNFLFLTQVAHSQNNVHQFYQEKNAEITAFAQSKDTAKLVAYYVKCLTKYDFTMLNDIDFDDSKGLEMAALIKDYESADMLFKYELSTGLVEAMFPSMSKRAPYSEYFGTDDAKQIMANYQKYRNIYKHGIHLAWISTVSGYFNMDQYSRTLFGNHYSWVTGNAYKRFDYLDDGIKKKITSTMIQVTDSLTFAAIYDAVNDYGFFTKSKTRGGLGPLLVHLYGPGRDQVHQGVSSTQFLDSVMLKAVKEGELSPREYIFMHDIPEYPYNFETKSTYGCAVRGKVGYYIPNEIIDIKNIDKRRAEIYLPPLWVDALLDGFELPEGYVQLKDEG
jgi:hypothetical protein